MEVLPYQLGCIDSSLHYFYITCLYIRCFFPHSEFFLCKFRHFVLVCFTQTFISQLQAATFSPIIIVLLHELPMRFLLCPNIYPIVLTPTFGFSVTLGIFLIKEDIRSSQLSCTLYNVIHRSDKWTRKY